MEMLVSLLKTNGDWAVATARIAPVFGPAALNVFPRVGHLHINVDGLPWHWADASNTGTIDIKDLPPGQHKVTVESSRCQSPVLSRAVHHDNLHYAPSI